MSIADRDWDEREKAARLGAFFSGEPMDRPRSELNIGLSDAERRQREEAKLDADLADLIGGDAGAASDELVPADPVGGHNDHNADTEATEPTCERIDDVPVLTPYDKARQRLTDAEILRDVAMPGSEEYHEAMAEMAAAKRALKVEMERATDDGWRKRRATDEWRAGEGREEYNASRRKVRDKPNAMTPKDVLDAMTPEERELHRKDKNAEKVWRYGRRKAGWSEERIEAGLPGWWERRLSRRDCD